MVEASTFAERLVRDRQARGLSQREAVERLRLHSDEELPDTASLLRSWKRWEGGQRPSPVYQAAVARMFQSVPSAYFIDDVRPEPRRVLSEDQTVELVERLRRSDIDDAALDAITRTVDALCTEYSYADPRELKARAQRWLADLHHLMGSGITYRQHGDVLALAGWLTLLIACLEWDTSNREAAEQARQAVLALGRDLDNPDLLGWAAEVQAWMNTTQHDAMGAVAAAREGLAVTRDRSVSVQLYAQEAKAWARLRDPARAHIALERGRELMASLPYPTNPRNHFEVDPLKVDFYAMDVWRMTGEDSLAASAAQTIMHTSVAPDGQVTAPMRYAEAEMTLAAVRARGGDRPGALSLAEAALGGTRQSVPSLLLVAREVVAELDAHGEGLEARLRDLAAPTAP